MRGTRKPLPRLNINGWIVDKMPNSFAEKFVWECKACNAEGYLILNHGFFSKRDAVNYAETHEAPKVKII